MTDFRIIFTNKGLIDSMRATLTINGEPVAEQIIGVEMIGDFFAAHEGEYTVYLSEPQR